MNGFGKYFQSKLIFGKYSLKYLISKGSFGEVYLGTNVSTNKNYALKIEERSSNSVLKDECYVLLNLKGPGIPSVITFGISGKYNILIENLLGKSIIDIFKENNNKLNLKDTFMFAIQALERLEYVHSKNYLHRDIKPGNFLVGNPDSSQIYLIDFGNARKYRSSRTGKHLKYHKTNIIFGTISFLSLNVLKGIEQTRKDELESLGLIIIFLHTGKLPWTELKFKTIHQALYTLLDIRQKISLEELCKGMPIEMQVYMKYVNDLKFGQDPDYEYFKDLFLIILKKFGEKNDLQFSWVKKRVVPPKVIKIKKIKSLREIYINLIQSNSNKMMMNASNSYINTKNKVKPIAEEKCETDIDKQKDFSNSDSNPINDNKSKCLKRINEKYKTINIIGKKNNNKVEYRNNTNKNQVIKTFKVANRVFDINTANINNINKLKKVKIPFPKKNYYNRTRNEEKIENSNTFSYPINNFNNDIKNKLNERLQNYLLLTNTVDKSNEINNINNCINISNININKSPNNYTYVTLFKKYETKKVNNQKKGKINNIKTKIYNNQSLTPLQNYNKDSKSMIDYYFDPHFKPVLYKSVISSRSMRDQTIPEITRIPKIINDVKLPLRTLSNNNTKKYIPVFSEKGVLIKKNINDKLKLNSKGIFYKRIINTNKSYTTNNSFTKHAFGNL